MAYTVPTDTHAHMRADVPRVRLVASYEVEPIETIDGFTSSIVGFTFACPEFPGEHRVLVPYDWDRDQWLTANARAARSLPPELYADVLAVVAKQSPFVKSEKKRLPV